MPPKKNAKNAKKGKEAAGPPPAKVGEVVDMKQLLQVTESLSQAMRLRNYFQLERDKLSKFWTISLHELEAAKVDLKLKDREMEEEEERHQVELKVYKQKVRHLLYEHKVHVQDLKESSEKALVETTDEHKYTTSDLKKDKRDLWQNLKDLIAEHEDKISNLRTEHQRLLQKRRENAERDMRDMSSKYEKKIAILGDELELRRKTEIHDIEERKNEHIKDLVAKHEAAFAEMKEYYNDITSKNLDLIKSLREEVTNMKKNEQYNEKLMFEIAQENKRLNEPLQKANKEVDTLRHELANYEKDKMSLKNTRSRLLVLEDQYKKLEDTQKELQRKYSRVEQERNNLLANYEESLQDVKQRSGFRNTALEKRAVEIQGALNRKDAQLGEVLRASNLEPASVELLTKRLEELLDTKNRTIKDLFFELAKIEQQHHDTMKAYEEKCKSHGIEPLDVVRLGLVKTGLEDATSTTPTTDAAANSPVAVGSS